MRIDASGKQVITLTVTDFYVPTQFTAKAGVPTTLVLDGKDSGGCARAFTIPEHCGLLIDDELEDIAGVRSSSTNAKTGRTTVHLQEGAAVEIAALIAAVEQAGEYTARPDR